MSRGARRVESARPGAVAVLGLAVLTLVATGCGDDSGEVGGAGGQSTSTATSSNVGTSATNASATTSTSASSTGSTSSSASTGMMCGGDVVWQQTIGGSSDQYLFGLGQDAVGNLLFAGRFLGATDFGAGPVTPDAFNGGVFIGKRDTHGNPVWARSIGTGLDQGYYAFTSDDAGNLYVAGQTNDLIDLGDGPENDPSFIGKVDGDGNLVWRKGYVYAVPMAMATDAAGNLIVAGDFVGSVAFGPTPITAAGGTDVFVAKFASNGDHLWSKAFGRPDEYVYAMKTDSAGNIVMGGVEALDTDSNAVLTKWDAQGNELWRRVYGGASPANIGPVAVDGNDNILVGGYFVDSIDFGGGALTGHDPGSDLFVAKLAPDATHVWSKVFGGSGSEYLNEVDVDPTGRVFLAGGADGPIDLGGGTITPVVQDGFFVVLDADGTYVTSQMPQAPSNEYFSLVEPDTAGQLVLGGYFGTPLLDLGCGALPHVEANDVLLAKIQL